MLHWLKPLAQTSAACILVAAFAGCAAGLSGGDPARAQAARAEATRLEASGDYAAAARSWLDSAEASRGGQREVALIEAVQAWLLARDWAAARRTLALLPAEGAPALALDRALVEAEVAIKSGEPRAGLEILEGIPAGPGDPRAAEILSLRADARFAAGDTAGGVADLVERERTLPPPERPANQRRIWNRLQEASARGVGLPTPPDADPTVAGWLELGRLAAAGRGSPFQLRAAILGWQQQHPGHPAAAGVTQELLIEARALTAYPSRLAMLLPLTGRQAAAAQAIRDGFIGGYLSMRPEGEAPVVSLYDTSALGPTAAYEQAVREGAEFVVGPLLKEELAEIATAQLPSVPTLALNWADDGIAVASHIAQFALAPEDEAAGAAERAADEGLCRALALVPDTEQGRRMGESFARALEDRGCVLLAWQRYFAGDRDFSAEITSLLLIDESDARHQRLQGFLGQPLEFEPRRRQDAQSLFLAARPAEGRLIRPQLKFHFAGDLPVFAGSAIYQPGERGNADLDGIRFADMPWRIDAAESETAMMDRFTSFGPGALERNGRLYAFGADAWRLVPFVHNRSGQLAEGVSGLTGTLFLGADGRVHRRLAWAQFSGGEVVPLPPPLPPPLPAPDAGIGE
jgi:outer membrane PBP1 activator LpoA protein